MIRPVLLSVVSALVAASVSTATAQTPIVPRTPPGSGGGPAPVITPYTPPPISAPSTRTATPGTPIGPAAAVGTAPAVVEQEPIPDTTPEAAAPAAPAVSVGEKSKPLPGATRRQQLLSGPNFQALEARIASYPPPFGSGSDTISVGQIQRAWDGSETTDGVSVLQRCDSCVYKVRTREFMTTTIQLPDDALIETADIGDAKAFAVQVRTSNTLAVRPMGQGMDSNLNVYTKSGAVYVFYLRADGFNSPEIPDLNVRIMGRDGSTSAVRSRNAPPSRSSSGSARASAPINDASGRGVAGISFDPSRLRGWADYKLWGSDDTLRPEAVYRDDYFTYIQYGERFSQIELPTAYVIVDGIDELVNTRVSGTTLVVESVAPHISLKSGKSYLCILRGDGAAVKSASR